MNEFKLAEASKEKTFVEVPEGTHAARLFGIIDLGLQSETEFGTGKPTKRSKILLQFEFVQEFAGDGVTPLTLSHEVNAFLSEKSNLVAALTALLGNSAKEALSSGVSLTEVVGKFALATVGRTSSGRAKITGFSSLPKAIKEADLLLTAKKELVTFDVDRPDLDVFNKLPAWVQKKIRAAHNAPVLPGNDVPFDTNDLTTDF